MKITPEQAREALDARICRPRMTQEQATILITEAFWALKSARTSMFSVSQMKVARLISERLALIE